MKPSYLLYAAGAVFTLLYYPATMLPPAGDDWLLIHPAQELIRKGGVLSALVGIFVTPVYDFYRPIALLPSVLSGQDFTLFQTLKLAAMLVFSWIIMRTAKGIGISAGWSTLAASVVLLHQVFVSVTTEVDLWGDLIPAIIFVVMIDLCRRFAEGEISAAYLYLASIPLSMICLLSKEAGVASFSIPLLFAFFQPVTLATSRRRKLVIAAILIFLITLLYMYVRSMLSLPSTGQSSYYKLSFGINILSNLALAILALLSPVNSIEVALGGIVWKVVAGLFVVTLGGGVLIGLIAAFRAGNWRWPAFLFFIMLLAQGPVFLMPHLTEANFTRSLAPGWLAVVYCLCLLDKSDVRLLTRRLLIAVFLGWFLIDLSAVYNKRSEIVTDQQRLARFRNELTSLYADDAPDTLRIAVVDPGYRGYSVYRQPLRQELQLGDVPFGVFESFQPRTVQSTLYVIADKEEAISRNADCIVYDDGHVEKLN